MPRSLWRTWRCPLEGFAVLGPCLGDFLDDAVVEVSLALISTHASSPRDCLIVQRTAPGARVEMERQRDLHNRIVQEIAQAGTQNRKALQGVPPRTPLAAWRSPAP